jgi:Uma2 family endonuclease
MNMLVGKFMLWQEQAILTILLRLIYLLYSEITTENFDREEKFNDYKKLDSLEEYVLISQDKIQVECFRRDLEGNWLAQTYKTGEISSIKKY